jgi:hypothetical protein
MKNFYSFLDSKKNKSFFSILNPTLIGNPYVSEFPKDWFFKNKKSGWIFEFFKSLFIFYFKMSIKLAIFTVQKIFFSKKISETEILIDTFLISNTFTNKYFPHLPEILEKRNISYSYLLRIYGNTLFPPNVPNGFYEFQIVKFSDIFKIYFQIFFYPFQTLSLLDKNKTFNYHLVRDIRNQSFEAFFRYWVGKRIAEMNFKKIFSWSEFQVIERAFNFGYRTNGGKGEIFATQFFLNYPMYLNTLVSKRDDEVLSAPHQVLVNGQHYLENKGNFYKLGVSLRYDSIFNFQKDSQNRENILLLASYLKKETNEMIDFTKDIDLKLKLHPTQKPSDFQIPKNFELVSGNLYEFFQTSKIVITTGSGTAVEAVAVGVSVIIVESQENLTANPLIEFGRGEIWELVSNREELENAIGKLEKFREENPERVSEISSWYKENFFVEPTEENIVKAFDL